MRLQTERVLDMLVSTHSRPKAAGTNAMITCRNTWFQHTAARRRLDYSRLYLDLHSMVSTHSRPKAAGYSRLYLDLQSNVSTHSRPKAAGASLKSLAPSGFAALISLSSQEKREREYNTAFSVTPAFAIS